MIIIETPSFPLELFKKRNDPIIKVIVCIIHTLIHIICSNKKELSRLSFYKSFL